MKQPPLVAHIIYALGTGGLENGLVNIINRTPPNRYRHAIICLTDADDFSRRITVPGVEVIQLHKRPGQDLGVFLRLLKVLRQLRPDVVHTRNLASLEMQAVTLLLPGVKRVHGEHGRDIHDLDGTSRKYNLLRKLLRPLIHKYIAVSKDLEMWLKDTVSVPDSKVIQIYNGVDSGKFSPCLLSTSDENPATLPGSLFPEDAVVVGTVGRLAEVKNQAVLVDAVHHLLTSRPDLWNRLRLLVVGGGPLYTFLKERIESLGLTDIVAMPGDRDDIPELLQRIDIFVLPSLAEGISNTLLEAMATGLPVVATAVGGNPELIKDGENGRLFPVSDMAGLAAILGELVDDASLRQRMGQQGLTKVHNTFDWDRTVAEYLGVYDELLGVERHEHTKNKALGNS